MKLRFIHERISPDGAVERTSADFDQNEVVIGRGGSSDIVLSSPQLSLVHAKVYEEGGQVLITEIDSLVGLRVNQVRVARQALNSGDTFQLGDLSFEVQLSAESVLLTLRVDNESAVPDAEVVARNTRKLELDAYLPSIRVLSCIASIIVLAGCFVYPIVRGRYSSWSSGPVANSHRMIEHDCQRCHLSPFERVEDRECLNCHTMSDHSEGFKEFVGTHRDLDVRCAECHMEHNGDHGLILRDSRQCISCHAGMRERQTGRDVLNVASFSTHPEFRVSVSDSVGAIRRVSLSDTQNVVDGTPIKLNHAVHLKEGLRGPQGPMTLQCNGCHQLSKDKREMLPIRFDTHCRECHSLGFDERLADSEVPHGDVDLVYPTLFAEYAKLLLLDGERGLGRPSEAVRALPGTGESPDESRHLTPDAKLAQANARRAEEELFTRTACFLCHDYREKPLSEQRSDGSRYTITPPRIPEVWMTKARFDHGAHEEVSCESCHEKTRRSTDTRDLLLPSIQVCRECHLQDAKPGFVKSECAQCHPYHAALEVSREKKQNLNEFLHTLMR
ncbi:MAG: hypothetical protein RL518_1993 [Pseudomonadota bacterium]